jgi:predicted transcriptional regulator
MTANRLELLRQVHRTPTRSVLAVARSLGRDYKRVHEDVEALFAAALLDRDEAGLRAEFEATGLHATQDEVDRWPARLEAGKDAARPMCHR